MPKQQMEIPYSSLADGLNTLNGLLDTCQSITKFLLLVANQKNDDLFLTISGKEIFWSYWLRNLQTKLSTCSGSIESCLFTLASMRDESFSRSEEQSEAT